MKSSVVFNGDGFRAGKSLEQGAMRRFVAISKTVCGTKRKSPPSGGLSSTFLFENA